MSAPEEKKNRNFIPLITKIAVAAAVILLFFVFKNRFPGFREKEAMRSFASANGERKTLQLPDGSGVTLNGGSKISIPGNYGSASRDIYLEGEAFFDVKHNKELPFIVHTPAMDVKAVGTAFNVKAYPCEKTTEASLISGIVEVTFKEEENRKMLLHPNEKVQWLKPTTATKPTPDTHKNTEAHLTIPVQTLTKTESGIIKEIAWTENKLAFYDESFEEIALLLERWYGAKIEFADNDIRSYRFTGEYEKEELGTILGFLKESKNFNYDIIRGSALTIKLYK
jgi:ferric-dicitrate binding protein FerR (iron transport regulator)